MGQVGRRGLDHGHPDHAKRNHNHDDVYAPSVHSHDDLYYTEAEVDALLVPEAWQSFTPTLTTTGTPPTLGLWTRSGRYIQRGKLVTFVASFTCNDVLGIGTGTYRFGIPVDAADGELVVVVANQSGPNQEYIGRGGGGTATVTIYRTDTFAAATDTNTNMAVGTRIRITGTYEAA